MTFYQDKFPGGPLLLFLTFVGLEIYAYLTSWVMWSFNFFLHGIITGLLIIGLIDYFTRKDDSENPCPTCGVAYE